MHIVIGPNNFDMKQVIPEIQKRHPDVSFEVCDDRESVDLAIGQADAYCGWLTRDTFLVAKKLRWIQSLSTGVDSFLRIPELKDGSVLLTNARGVHAVCLAEQTFAMLFSFTRGMKAFLEHQQRHEWAGRRLRDTLVELMGNCGARHCRESTCVWHAHPRGRRLPDGQA
jgi:phosphoglycerate dehydrogenase-like enzyme